MEAAVGGDCPLGTLMCVDIRTARSSLRRGHCFVLQMPHVASPAPYSSAMAEKPMHKTVHVRGKWSCAFSRSEVTWPLCGILKFVQAKRRTTRKEYPENMPEISREEVFEKELEKHERKRHRKKWKGDAKRVASKLSSAIKKHGVDSKHSESESPSLSESRSTDRSIELESFRNPDDSNVSEGEDLAPSSFFSGDDDKWVGTSSKDFPPPLSGGVVVDQKYAVSAKALNAIIFKSGSAFTRDLHEAQKVVDYVEEPWKKVGNEFIKRSVTYTRAATKLIKAIKAFETQTYLRAGDEGFCILLSSSTPDAPFGRNFVIEMQVVNLALPDLPSGEKSCHLQLSWRVNFLQSTLMKGMIENGARNGILETFAVYQEVLSRHATRLESRAGSATPLASRAGSATPLASRSDLPACEDEKLISDWEIAWANFKKWHVLLALVSMIFILLHIALAPPKRKSGLEFWIIRFPDSLMELFTSVIVVVQVERVAIMVYNFILSYYLQSADHGVKAQGDGWIIKVSLIEGANIALCDSDTPNPYAVFTCNGKHRTSSVNLGTTHPTWREVFEFNPTEDPPSTMDVEVFHYDGPFSEAKSLSHAEINFLKQSPGQLADFWLPLNGKGAQKIGSELHLCVYLTNTRDGHALHEYVERFEREAGLKVRKRPARKNGSFQKLFSLPAEEFLMNDFICAIKRKILIQGRLFLSPRLLGFYSNLFGHKSKFTLLWDDIEEIKESVAQSITPSIIVFTRKGRGFDALHGARGIDEKGRLKFQFMSFVRYGSAFRAIVTLWKNLNLSNQKMDVLANLESGDMKYAAAERQADDHQFFPAKEVTSMSEVVHMQIPITVESVNAAYEDDKKDHFLNEKLGLSNYKSSPWEVVDGKNEVQRRHRTYRLEPPITQFGSKVSSIQQKTMSADFKLVINENFTLDDVPFGDHFQIQVRMELETLSMQPITTQYKAFAGVAWLKTTELDQWKITKNINEYMTNQLQYFGQLIVDEARR